MRLIRSLLALSLAVAAAPAAKLGDDAQRYLEHVKTLAAPEMKGRGAGSPELDDAADYIAAKFEEYGLEPAGENGYRQSLTVTTGAEMGQQNRLLTKNVAGEQTLDLDEQWAPINFSSSGEVAGPVVFVGYGATSEEKGYDDYAGVDVKDKLVVILRYEPPVFGTQEGDGPRRYSRHANLIAKAINARNHGAKAVILVNGDMPEDRSDELIRFGTVAGPADAGILMVQVKNDVADGWLRRSGQSLQRLQRDIDATNQPRSFELAENFKVELAVDIERKRAEVSNVVGYLPGETDEYVIIGAHYDHLGLGDISSLAPDLIGQVHHGADDNASGVAGVLELARRFGDRKKPLERGLLFMTFAGEEIGLLGSAHWVDQPTKPLDKAVAMLNMDMVGRIDKGKVYIGGVGTAPLFNEVVERVDENYSFVADYSESGYSASDHTSFLGKDIPALFFFSGLHSDYHKPSDTWDKINAEAAVELVDLVGRVTEELAQAEERPQFTQVAPPSHGHGSSGDGAGGGYGPYFGSIPDFAEIPDGVRFADIRPESPAAKGGLEAGDILTSFDGKPIKNLYDFTYALRDSKVGQTVEVGYLRDGAERTTEVTLEERR